ncbi:hypothetical protein C0991_009353 [Blastosporella zonata]|nr:hypothetical protein C0991_009353 [Blastosporella zonata]
MRLLRTVVATLSAAYVLPVTALAGNNNLVKRDADFGVPGDVCGEVNSDLTVPNVLVPGKYITLGHISEYFALLWSLPESSNNNTWPHPADACLCLSALPSFMTTHPYGLAAVALAGKDHANQALTNLVSHPGSYPSLADL